MSDIFLKASSIEDRVFYDIMAAQREVAER